MESDELIAKVSLYISEYNRTISHLPQQKQNIKRIEMLKKMYACTIDQGKKKGYFYCDVNTP